MYQKLRCVREASGTFQITLSELLGFSSKNAYSQKERGERKFTVDEAIIIANYFHMSVEELFYEAVEDNTELPKAS